MITITTKGITTGIRTGTTEEEGGKAKRMED